MAQPLHPVGSRVASSSRVRWRRPSHQTESTGTSELDSRNDAIIAKPTASESGTNSDRDTPVMKNDGTNTATTDNMASSRGTTTSPLASSTARATRCAARQVGVDVLDRHRGLIDEDADGQRQAAERHDVDRLTRAPQRDDRGEQRKRNRDHDNRRAAPVAQEQQHHQAGQERTEHRFLEHGLRARQTRCVDWSSLYDTVMSSGTSAWKRPRLALHLAHDAQRRGVRALRDRDVDGAPAVHQGIRGRNVGAVADGADVANRHGRAGTACGSAARADR